MAPGKLGLGIFLISDASSFAALMLAYGMLRLESASWRHEGEPALDLATGLLLSGLLVGSSVAVELLSRFGRVGAGALVAALMGAAFLLVQSREDFGTSNGLWTRGLHVGASGYASTFYLLTGFHALHVFVGAIAMAAVGVRSWLRRASDIEGKLVTLYWHFVDGVWLMLFVLLYALPGVRP
jgi:cytochrome c oxidase subunit 3